MNASFGVIVAVGLYFIGVPSPIALGRRCILAVLRPLLRPVYRRWFSHGPGGDDRPGLGHAARNLSLVSYCRTRHRAGSRALALRPQYGDLSGSRRDLGDILVVDVGHCLVLSTPLTVCLVVLGRHVERLAFLDVIFGDTPPLTPVENFYQRMLARDASEVSDQAEQFLKTNSLVNYYDEVVLQALLMAQADLRRGVLDEAPAKAHQGNDRRSHRESVGSCRSAACSDTGARALCIGELRGPFSANFCTKSFPKSCGNRRGADARPAARQPGE